MASSVDDGRLLLYMQQIKREHKHIMKRFDDFTDSMRKIDTLYEAMQEKETRMRDMDRRIAKFAEDDGAMADSFKKLGSESKARFGKAWTELEGLSHKIARLEALEREHNNRFESNVPLLKGIQSRLEQLDGIVGKLSKDQGKLTKGPHPDLGNLVQEISYLRSFVQEQEKSWRNLREEVNEVKQKARQLNKSASQARTQPEEQPSGVIPPSTPTPPKPPSGPSTRR